MENTELFKTNDIELAAVLISLGENFLDAIGDPWRLDFIFTKSEEIQGIERDLLARKIRLEPLCLLSSHRKLRSIVGERRRATRR